MRRSQAKGIDGDDALTIGRKTIKTISVVHKDHLLANVCVATWKRTFAASIVNGNLGSVPAFEGTRFRHQRMSVVGYVWTAPAWQG
jgi:hypothetical protein